MDIPTVFGTTFWQFVGGVPERVVRQNKSSNLKNIEENITIRQILSQATTLFESYWHRSIGFQFIMTYTTLWYKVILVCAFVCNALKGRSYIPLCWHFCSLSTDHRNVFPIDDIGVSLFICNSWCKINSKWTFETLMVLPISRKDFGRYCCFLDFYKFL